MFAGIYEYDENESMFDNQLEPPYQPGDIIYVRETWHKYIKRVGEGQNCHLAEFYGYKASVANFSIAGLGENVFLTLEEAEKKLEEMQNAKNA